MQKIVSARYQTSFFRRYLMLAFLVIMGYLCQVCVIPYCSIAGVAPNLLYVVIGIVTVAYGKLRAFWVAMVFGLLMEIMLPSVTFVSLAVYPLSALFCSFSRVVIWDFWVVMVLFICSISSCIRSTSMDRPWVS